MSAWPMATVTQAIEKRARSCGFTLPRTPGVQINKRGTNVWSCSVLTDANGQPVGERFFWVENGCLKMGKVKP
jgi:hypothetical protein